MQRACSDLGSKVFPGSVTPEIATTESVFCCPAQKIFIIVAIIESVQIWSRVAGLK